VLAVLVQPGKAGDVDPKQVVGRNIREARKRLDLTQEALADRCGTSVQQVSRAERGKHDLRISTVVLLAHGLEVSAVDLLRGL
jgi:transcriptional regulator with XRE-family HTH domain